MSRYKNMFQSLSTAKKGCFVPFVVLGDPNIELSVQIIHILIQNGADAIELGIPFSDPVADGPILQKANRRALLNHNTFSQYFNIIKNLRKQYSKLPIGVLIYANIIYNQGIKNFYLQCLNSGLDSVLIADVPIEESDIFYQTANKYHISSVFICPPDANDILLSKIVKYSQGYIYLLSRSGVTGIEYNNITSSKKLISKLKKGHNTPVLQGFGISNTTQIQKIISWGASGVICGSVIVHIIEKYLFNRHKMIEKLTVLTQKLKKSTQLI